MLESIPMEPFAKANLKSSMITSRSSNEKSPPKKPVSREMVLAVSRLLVKMKADFPTQFFPVDDLENITQSWAQWLTDDGVPVEMVYCDATNPPSYPLYEMEMAYEPIDPRLHRNPKDMPTVYHLRKQWKRTRQEQVRAERQAAEQNAIARERAEVAVARKLAVTPPPRSKGAVPAGKPWAAWLPGSQL